MIYSKLINRHYSKSILSEFKRIFKTRKTTFDSVTAGLTAAYTKNLLPVEELTLFHELQSPQLYESDFEAKPFVLLMGQYSTGKTTLLRYILQQDFPGMRIGPEPTTDRFIAIMHGAKERTIPGNALSVDASKPFAPLSKYGNAFLSRFQCSEVPSPILEGLTLIDTPGILSGEKQRLDRGYDFAGVLEWFAERVDRIILLFDANKLDISDEFKSAIESVKGNEEKIRIVLNKSDSMDMGSLMRVYGSLMWSLGKVLKTPEVSRVYIGSFWDRPYVYSDLRKLFEGEEKELLKDLQSLYGDSMLRKTNDLSKRARLLKVHALIMKSIKERMPIFMGREKSKQLMIENLADIFGELQTSHAIAPGDFPPVQKMQERLRRLDFNRLSAVSENDLKLIDDISGCIGELMDQLYSAGSEDKSPQDGAFEHLRDESTPFSATFGSGFNASQGETGWEVAESRGAADAVFDKLLPIDGKMGKRAARVELLKSGLPSGVLGQIYALADVDQDGLLDRDEYALAQYIISLKVQGYDLPSTLPPHLVPPSKREDDF